MAVGTASRLVAALEAVARVPVALRGRFAAYHPERVYLVRDLVARDPARALALVASARPGWEIEADAAREAGTHREPVGHVVRLALSEGAFRQWSRAWHLVRVHCGVQGSAFPSDSEVVEMIAATVLNAPELVAMDPGILEEVCAGLARCVRCGSVAHLHRHHVVPRSRGGRDAHGVEQVRWMCAACHARVHARAGDSWRAVARDVGVQVPDGRGRTEDGSEDH